MYVATTSVLSSSCDSSHQQRAAVVATSVDSLGDEAATLALVTRLGVWREEQLGPVEHVDKHRQLGLHERLQLLLQQLHDVLQHTKR